jgi:hypothetical protein
LHHQQLLMPLLLQVTPQLLLPCAWQMLLLL